MMIALITGIAALFSGISAWSWSSWRERKKSAVRLSVLERELRTSERKSAGLVQEVTRLKDAVQILDRSLVREREAKEEAFRELKNPFRKGSLAFGSAFLAAGLLAGSFFTGTVAKSQIDLEYRERLTALEVEARVAETKAEWMEKSYDTMRSELKLLRKRILEEQEQRAVALTKLEIILEHLIVRKSGREITVNLDKMKQDMTEGRYRASSQKAVDKGLIAIPMPSLW